MRMKMRVYIKNYAKAEAMRIMMRTLMFVLMIMMSHNSNWDRAKKDYHNVNLDGYFKYVQNKK